MTEEVVRKHLAGAWTIGQYLLRRDNTVDFAALDLDVAPPLADRLKEDQRLRSTVLGELRSTMDSMKGGAGLGIDLHFEWSGRKGVHAWVFFSDPAPASDARLLLEYLAGQVKCPAKHVTLEIFPKQTRLSGKGFGISSSYPSVATSERSALPIHHSRSEADQDSMAYVLSIQPTKVRSWRRRSRGVGESGWETK